MQPVLSGRSAYDLVRSSHRCAHGYGMVLGEDRKKARDLAIVDAVYAVGGNEILLLAWEEMLEEERQRLAEAEQKRAEALLRTQVDFSTMEV